MDAMRVEKSERLRLDRAIAVLEHAAALAIGQESEMPAEMPTEDELRALPVSEFRTHVDAMIVGRDADVGLEVLQRAGVLRVWLPEIEAMVGFSDGEWRHKDVWKHTRQVVKQSVPRPLVRWGALLHDIGKPKTRKIDERGQVHFYGHSEVGAAMFRRKLARRLGFEGADFERIHFLILYHLRANQYDGSWTDSAVRRFYKEMGDGLDDLLCLSRADITTKRPERRRRGLRQISELADRIRKLKAEDEKIAPLPKGLGTGITERFGIPPSKRIGEVRRMLEEEIAEGVIEGGHEVDYYLDRLAAQPERYGLS